MHTVILIDSDTYCLDTETERALAARHMSDARVFSMPVYRGGPETDLVPEGRDFCASADGRHWSWSRA